MREFVTAFVGKKFESCSPEKGENRGKPPRRADSRLFSYRRRPFPTQNLYPKRIHRGDLQIWVNYCRSSSLHSPGKNQKIAPRRREKTEVVAAAKGRGLPSSRDLFAAVHEYPIDGKKKNATGRGLPSRRDLLAAVQACPSDGKKSATGRRERKSLDPFIA